MAFRIAAYTLLVLSTSTASVAAARTPVLVPLFVASVALMVVSVLMLRRVHKPAVTALASGDSGEKFDFHGAVGTVVAGLERLMQARDSLECETVHRGLDGLIDGPLFDFAGNRDELLGRAGFGPFARVMGEFTRGERMVNRAWSAAVDGHLPESLDSMETALEVFRGVASELEELPR